MELSIWARFIDSLIIKPMAHSLAETIQIYAELIIKIGVNLQVGQGLSLTCEPIHRKFAQALVVAAYKAGAKHVDIVWHDTLMVKARFQNASADAAEYYPGFDVARRRQIVEEGWATLRVSGEECPGLFDDVDPALVRRAQEIRFKNTSFFADAQMADLFPWCVVAAPTPNWALKLFPDLPVDKAIERLWWTILRAVRADMPDPIAAWRQHDVTLIAVANTLMSKRVTELHFLDSVPDADGLPSTDLRVGLVADPVWVAASAVTPSGIRFLPNMPTEEVFTTPHRLQTSGYVRLSKPAIISGREVRDGYFRFENGAVVEHRAGHNQDALDQLMAHTGARHLGEVALVDVRSPINQTGILFYDGLFDENAVCHIAFGRSYPTAVRGGVAMSPDQLMALGANNSDTHEDLMIGTKTMQVDGLCADGTHINIMQDGQFVL